MNTCSRWRVRARFVSGLYSTENSGLSGLGDIGVDSDPGFVVGIWTLMSEIVLGGLRGTTGMELEIAEFDETSQVVLSIGEVVVGAFRPGEGAGSVRS